MFYLHDITSQISSERREELNLFKTSDVHTKDNKLKGIPRNYAFIGSRIEHYGPGGLKVPIVVKFLPLHHSSGVIDDCAEQVNIRFTEASKYSCDFYVKGVGKGIKTGSGYCDISSSSGVEFTIADNEKLIGSKLSFMVTTRNDEYLVSFRVSSSRDVKNKIEEIDSIKDSRYGWIMLLTFCLLTPAILLVLIDDYRIKSGL